MGINIGLRLLILSLSLILFLLITYYFLVINRNQTPSNRARSSTLVMQEMEKKKADVTLASKVKTVLSQTRRLYNYNIGVDCKDGVITLSGEVTSAIDKELASTLTQEISGIREVKNQLKIVAGSLPTLSDSELNKKEALMNVDDLELQANLREKFEGDPDFKNHLPEIKVHNRTVVLSGAVASDQQRTRAEQIVQGFPKVSSVTNLLKVTGSSSPTAASGSQIQ